MFEQKIKMNRKKNLSSKIIVDEYDHLIKNSKIQPNFDSFMQPPLSPHFNPKDVKYTVSKQQSSQSQYSMQNIKQQSNQKECYKCGQLFPLRVYQSHFKNCQQKVQSNRKQDIKNFNKKDQYNFIPSNINLRQQGRIASARNNMKNQNIIENKFQLKKSNSKVSIQSHQKKNLKRPSSSTRNKLDIKGHQNLKQKILNKLEGNRQKNHQIKPETYNKSKNKKTLSNSKPKSISKNIHQNKKFTTMNSSSINKKNLPHRGFNYDFNRSQIFTNTSGDNKKKEKTDFLSKVNIKEEKKQILKKKNINSNNSLVLGLPFQRQKDKSKKTETFNFKDNSSYFSQSDQVKNKSYHQKQLIKQQLRKEGPFRRQSSNSASKRKFNQKHKKELMRQNPNLQRQLNEEYFFFENHPSTVPNHVTKRYDRPVSRYEMQEEQFFEENSSNIIRSKLGLNKNSSINTSQQNRKQAEIKNTNKFSNQVGQMSNSTNQQKSQLWHSGQNQHRDIFPQNVNSTQNESQFRHGQIRRNIQRPEDRIRNNQHNVHTQRFQEEIPQRPLNPMGNSRNGPIRRQNLNRVQNRPQTRIQNSRIHSQNVQRQNQNEPIRNHHPRNQQNHRQAQNNRRPEQRRRENQNHSRQTNPNRRQQGQRNNRRIHQDTLNFISNTLNQQFQVMNEHFNLLNNIFSNFSNIVNVNITASTNNQNPTTFHFRSNERRRNNNRQDFDNEQSSQTHSEYSDFSSDFSDDQSLQNETDYSEYEYHYEMPQNENPGMTEHEINSIPILRYSKQHHGSNQCTICLVELNQSEPFKKLYCDHVFHTECIDEWLKRKNACPVCRDQMGVRH